MAFELVETSQLFARMVARVEPEWLLERGGHLLKRTYGEPHWSEKSGRASVKEHSTLYGLTVAKDRSVDYAAVAPERARRMFIDHALVRGEYTSRGAFQARNRARMAEVAKVRDKARKSEMLRSDDVLFALFDARVPAEVVNGKTFEAWREVAERADPAVLDLTVADLLAAEDNLRAEDYPDEICLHGTPVPLTYRFDPSADDDGVTLSVPLLLVPQLEPGELEWAVPGWMREKIFLLLDALPKSVRRELGPTGALADELHRDLDARARPWIDSFRSALVSAVAERTGVSVDPDALRLHHLPPYLRAFVRIVDGSGKVIDEGRDVEALLDRHGARARAAWKAEVTAPAWERTELKAWPTGASSNGGVGRGGSGSGGSARGAAGDPMGGDPLGSSAGELPPFVERRAKGVGTVRSYPALVDRGQWVDLVLMESEEAAAVAMRGGVHRLVQIAARQALSVVVARAPRPFALAGGSMLSRANGEKFRDAFVACVVDDAFELRAVPGAPPLPRSAREFEARLRAGLPRIDGTFRAWEKAIAQASAELDALTKTMSSAARHPSGQLVVSEVRAQLGHLFPDDVLRVVSLDRWAHYPRYLRAAQRRIERALADPRKDLDKLAPFTKLWTSFVEKLPSLRDKQGAALLRWQFEELRVAIFAPELRTPAPVSVASVTAALGALR
jgi:ATP-dependent helicase HrpA